MWPGDPCKPCKSTRSAPLLPLVNPEGRDLPPPCSYAISRDFFWHWFPHRHFPPVLRAEDGDTRREAPTDFRLKNALAVVQTMYKPEPYFLTIQSNWKKNWSTHVAHFPRIFFLTRTFLMRNLMKGTAPFFLVANIGKVQGVQRWAQLKGKYSFGRRVGPVNTEGFMGVFFRWNTCNPPRKIFREWARH